jgi:CDP-glucose 4,6-dehydratase
MNLTWWRDRRVFITGHTGFKGAWLCLLLRRLGAKVRGYSLLPATEPNLFTLAAIGDFVETQANDVRNLQHLTDALRRSDADIVIHMAAQSLVRESYQDPVTTYATNFMGTVNLLEAVRQVGEAVRAVLIVTSDKCYENRESAVGYAESAPLGGHDPYSSSKACAELATAAYRKSFFDGSTTAIATARAGNVIGGGDWARDRLIPDLVNAFAAGRRAAVRHPDSVRPWQFVLDPLSGYLTLLEYLRENGGDFAEAWNFGPSDDDARPVRWIADEMAAQWGAGAAWEPPGPGRHPHETACLKLDAGKAIERLHWRPCTSLATGVRWTAQWYAAWHQGADVRELCEKQIEAFLELSAEP